MLRQYWRRVHRVALHAALGALGLDALDRAFLRIGGAAIGVVLVWIATKGGTTSELILRVLATGTAIALVPVVYVWKFITTPANLDRDAQTTIADLNRRIDDREKRRQVQRRLGQFIESGQDILVDCHRTGHNPPFESADKWEQEVQEYIRSNLDQIYYSRFRNWSDIPKEDSRIDSTPHDELWQAMRARLARLHEYIQKLEQPGSR